MAAPATNRPVVPGLDFVVMWAKRSMTKRLAQVRDKVNRRDSVEADHPSKPATPLPPDESSGIVFAVAFRLGSVVQTLSLPLRLRYL